MGKNIRILIWYFPRSLETIFLVKILDPDGKNSDPESGIVILDAQHYLYDYTLWFDTDSLQDYCLLGFITAIRQLLVSTKTVTASHVPGRGFLPSSHYIKLRLQVVLKDRDGRACLCQSPPFPPQKRSLFSPPSSGALYTFQIGLGYPPQSPASLEGSLHLPPGGLPPRRRLRCPCHRGKQRRRAGQLSDHPRYRWRNHHHRRVDPQDISSHHHPSPG
jgi:hypothetical protein